jgi:hypothetical protein
MGRLAIYNFSSNSLACHVDESYLSSLTILLSCKLDPNLLVKEGKEATMFC